MQICKLYGRKSVRPFPETLAELLEQPFLTTPDWERFVSLVQERIDDIGVGESVLCAEADSVDALVVIFTTLLKKGVVFLANPNWRQNEWKQVGCLAGFHKVFGQVPIVADSSSAQRYDEARVMIPSGGTSGVVRFCVHSLDTLASAVNALYLHQFKKALNSFATLPMFHVSGLMPVWRALLTGGRVQLTGWKNLDGDTSPEKPGHPCSISLVPTQLFHLVQSSSGLSFLHSLDVIFLGGGRTPPALVQLIRYEKLPVEFVYGMTETAAMVVYGTRGDTDESGAVWGQALPGVEITLSENGEIIVRSESLFRGYYPEDRVRRDHSTGDLGRWVTKDLLEVLGRKDFIINSGGEKVNPEEVESLMDFLVKGGSAVVGLPDEKWGQKVVAVVEQDMTKEEIRQLVGRLSQQLASYKVPARVLTGFPIPGPRWEKLIDENCSSS